MSGRRPPLRSIIILTVVAVSMVFTSACHGKPQTVTTYHYDNLRTGWNSHEDRLTPHKVAGPHFAMLQTVTLAPATVQSTGGNRIVFATLGLPLLQYVFPLCEKSPRENFSCGALRVPSTPFPESAE
jgi:hypothetical protein